MIVYSPWQNKRGIHVIKMSIHDFKKFFYKWKFPYDALRGTERVNSVCNNNVCLLSINSIKMVEKRLRKCRWWLK